MGWKDGSGVEYILSQVRFPTPMFNRLTTAITAAPVDPPGLVATPVIPTPRGEVGDSGQHHRQLYSEFKASPGGLHKIEYKVKCPITKSCSGFSWKAGKTGEGSILSVDQLAGYGSEG